MVALQLKRPLTFGKMSDKRYRGQVGLAVSRQFRLNSVGGWSLMIDSSELALVWLLSGPETIVFF